MNFLSFLKRLVRYSSFLVRVVFLAVISLIPKSKKVWVFGAWFGKKFADNPKYFFNYIKNLPEGTIKPIWICKARHRSHRMFSEYNMRCRSHPRKATRMVKLGRYQRSRAANGHRQTLEDEPCYR